MYRQACYLDKVRAIQSTEISTSLYGIWPWTVCSYSAICCLDMEVIFLMNQQWQCLGSGTSKHLFLWDY